MRLKWSALLPVLAILLTTSCFDNSPSFPTEPAIEFSSFCFRDSKDSGDADTLILSLKFKDGDGDLGLSSSEAIDSEAPFNEKFYFQKQSDGSLTKLTKYLSSSMLNYRDKRLNPRYDTLPSFVPPFSCSKWEVITDGNTTSPKILDTLYRVYNPAHYNIHVDFFTKNFDGSFTKFDWDKFFTYPNCEPSGFNGRFPILAKDLSVKSPLEGNFTYKMESRGFKLIFSIKTLKLKIRVTDRALNKSNELETPEFTLQSITCN
jgi:hypothetical protein